MNKKILVFLIIILIVATSVSVAIYQMPSENHAPVASAVADIKFGKSPLTVQFNCTAIDYDNDEIMYEWDFGDGSFSNLQNPIHTYNGKGKYLVKLIAMDGNGKTVNDSLEINVMNYNPPLAIASSDLTSGKYPLEVNFNGSGYDSDGSISMFEWDFGDGTDCCEQNPNHTFDEEGRYFVHLTVTDNDRQIGTDMMEINVLGNNPPRAYASANVVTLLSFIPLVYVKFYGRGVDSDGEKLTYKWNFGLNTKPLIQGETSNEQNPQFIYWMEGTYNVKLTVTDEEGDSDTDTLQINVQKNTNTKSSGSDLDISEIILALINNRDATGWRSLLKSFFEMCDTLLNQTPAIIDFLTLIIERYFPEEA